MSPLPPALHDSDEKWFALGKLFDAEDALGPAIRLEEIGAPDLGEALAFVGQAIVALNRAREARRAQPLDAVEVPQ